MQVTVLEDLGSLKNVQILLDGLQISPQSTACLRCAWPLPFCTLVQYVVWIKGAFGLITFLLIWALFYWTFRCRLLALVGYPRAKLCPCWAVLLPAQGCLHSSRIWSSHAPFCASWPWSNFATMETSLTAALLASVGCGPCNGAAFPLLQDAPCSPFQCLGRESRGCLAME